MTKNQVKNFTKKWSLIILAFLIFISMFRGMREILWKIIPDDLAYLNLGGKDEEFYLPEVLAFLLAIGCFICLFMGYRFYKGKHWRVTAEGTIDRDELIYFLEKHFNLIEKLNQPLEDYDQRRLFEEKLKNLKEVIQLYEQSTDKWNRVPIYSLKKEENDDENNSDDPKIA